MVEKAQLFVKTLLLLILVTVCPGKVKILSPLLKKQLQISPAA